MNRSTSGLERINQDIKRRTRVVRILANRQAGLGLVTAPCVEQSDERLSGRRYLHMSHLGPGEDAALGALSATEVGEGDIAA